MAQTVVGRESRLAEARRKLVESGFQTISLVLIGLHAALETLDRLILSDQSLRIVLRPFGIIAVLRLHDQKLIFQASVLGAEGPAELLAFVNLRRGARRIRRPKKANWKRRHPGLTQPRASNTGQRPSLRRG